MKVIDREQRSSLCLHGEGIQQVFRMKQTMLPPRYTTSWNELLIVEA